MVTRHAAFWRAGACLTMMREAEAACIASARRVLQASGFHMARAAAAHAAAATEAAVRT